MICPDCNGVGVCGTCEGDGQVPDWLKDPKIMGPEAAQSWIDAVIDERRWNLPCR